jgi:uncharacterized membrane protein
MKLIGLRSDHRALIRTMGWREIASGIGILTQPLPVQGVWSRVGGDLIDIAGLGATFLSKNARRSRTAAAAAAVVGVSVVDFLCAQQLSRGAETRQGALPVEVSLAINRSPEEIYRFWRDFENLPRFMSYLESVMVTGKTRSHWVAKGPAGTSMEWTADIIEDRPNEVIGWQTLKGADVDHTGTVRFEPSPNKRGTIVTVDMQYSPPGGTLGAGVAFVFGKDPAQTIKSDLRRLKQFLETGEIITTEGQPAGRMSSTSWKYDLSMRY